MGEEETKADNEKFRNNFFHSTARTETKLNPDLISMFSQACEHGESTSHSSISSQVSESSFNCMPSGHEQLKLNQDEMEKKLREKINISTVNISEFCIRLPAIGVRAVMTARMRQSSAFIDVAAAEAVMRQLIARPTLAVERAERIVAHAVDAGRVETLVNVVAVELVVAEHKAVGTGALVCAFGVYADVRAVVEILTLVQILTGEVVGAQLEASLTGAAMRANKISADVGAVSIVLGALVDIDTGKSVVPRFVSVVAGTMEAALGVYAIVLATVKNNNGINSDERGISISIVVRRAQTDVT